MNKFSLPRHPMHLKNSANLWAAVLPGEGFRLLQDAISQPSKHAETYAPGELVEYALPAPCLARNPRTYRHLLSESPNEPSERGFDEYGRFSVPLATG